MCGTTGVLPGEARPADLPPPLDLSHHFSRTSNHRYPSQVKRFYKYFSIPGIGNLAGGLPNPGYFPYDTLEATAALPNRFKPTPNDPVDPPTADLAATTLSDSRHASHVVVPHDSSEANVLRRIDLTTALQYGTAQGYPPLYTFVRQFTQTNLHPNVPYNGGPEIILTVGSTDGFAKSLEAFTNIWDEQRDWIRDREGMLCEEFAYMNAIQAAAPRGLNIVPVKIDDEGMLAEGKGGLRDVLENWDKFKGKRPHIMYTVTMGQNPTSGLLSLQRRKEIYALCHQYDIIIIEDDPYWYLQYPSANALSIKTRGKPVSENYPTANTHNYNTSSGGKSSGFAFLDSLVPSYLSVDTDGRVVRLDTFSKTVAPGCRLGWITAQPAFVNKILQIAETSTQQPSGFVQSLIAELIMGPSNSNGDPGKGGSADGSGWKVDGWVRWLEGLRGNYERRMQVMSTVLEEGKYLIKEQHRALLTNSSSEDEDDFEVLTKTQIYDFAYPMAGMFLWLRTDFTSHPLAPSPPSPSTSSNRRFSTVPPSSAQTVPFARLSQALWIFMTTEDYKVLIAPGTMFSPTAQIRDEKGWQYFRLCFAAVDDSKVKEISERFVKGMQDFWEIKDKKTIDELLKDFDQEGQADERSQSQIYRPFAESGEADSNGNRPTTYRQANRSSFTPGLTSLIL